MSIRASRAKAAKLWNSSISPKGTIGLDYVKGIGALHLSNKVRFNIACPLVGASQGLKVPAILFAYHDPQERLVGVERHLLDPDSGTLILQDFLGDAATGVCLTGDIEQPLGYPFGRLCVAQSVMRALEVAEQTGCVCAAVWEKGPLKTLNPPSGIHEVCVDAQGIDSRELKAIRSALLGRAYLFSTIAERYPRLKPKPSIALEATN